MRSIARYSSRHCFAQCAGIALVTGLATAAHAEVLFDGSLGTSIQSQGWLGYGASGSPTVTQNPSSVTFDSTASNSIQAGWGSWVFDLPTLSPKKVNAAFPTMDSVAGYTIRFDVRLQSQTPSTPTPNRAGFSIIAVSADTTKAIELSLWSNEVWVQKGGIAPDLFTHGNGVAFDTTTAITRYDLAVLGSSYALYAGGNQILTGTLQDYTAFTTISPLNPYRTSSFLYLGDDTTEMGGKTDIAYLSFTQGALPTPGTGALALAGLALARRRRN